MSVNDIINIIKMRIAVYKAGCMNGLWPCLEENAAKEYMNYLFPKSSNLAFYNLMINVVQKKHEEFIHNDMYSLFKCPIQLEEEIHSYLKEHLNDDIFTSENNPIDFLQSMATVVCDPSFVAVYIGQLSEGIDNKLRVMAFHYKNLFSEGTNCYPYFN